MMTEAHRKEMPLQQVRNGICSIIFSRPSAARQSVIVVAGVAGLADRAHSGLEAVE
jgi:hypothetical protein